MSEKRGHTVKLEYDFDTARNLEIYFPNNDRWNRVTSRVFRSFNGKRKIQGENYEGPIYLYGTNKIISSNDYPKDKIVEYNLPSIRRPGENW